MRKIYPRGMFLRNYNAKYHMNKICPSGSEEKIPERADRIIFLRGKAHIDISARSPPTEMMTDAA